MVARIDISVEFHHPCMATVTSQGTDSGLGTYPIGQGGVEQLDEVVSYILFKPFVEQGT